MRKLLAVCLVFLLACTSAMPNAGLPIAKGTAPSFLTTPFRSVGINAPYGYSPDGATWVAGSYANWAAAMPSALKTAIVAAGFNTVRLYIDPGPLLIAKNSGASDATLNAMFAAGPIVAINDLTAAGLRVIVDMHIQGSPSTPAGWGSSDIINNVANGATKFNILIYCATLVAQAILPYGNNVIFELFNEWPLSTAFTGVTQQAQLLTYYNAIRAVAPALTLIVSGMNFADETTLINNLDPTIFDANTMFAIHTYNPLPFTQQDSIVLGFFQYVNRLPFDPATQGSTLAAAEANAATLVNADTSLSSGTKTSYINSINTYLAAYFNTPQSTMWLQNGTANPATAWADSHGIARYRLAFDEFGSIGDPTADNPRSGYISPAAGGLGGDVLSRANYYGAITNKMRAIGASWSVHSLEADYFEITNGSQVLVPSIISALFNGVPYNYTLPVVTGTAQVGQTLTSTPGTWTQSPASYAFQWKRAGTTIGGATGTTYIPIAADIGSTLTSTVVATNTSGSSSPAVSAPTSAVISGGGGSCPQGTVYPDGCSGATAGTAQNATLLNTYGANRPPWNVAGVDYRVGLDTGALSDASTTLPGCASFTNNDFNHGNRVTINTTPCTLDHLDFSLHGGICLTMAANSGGTATITYNKFTSGVNCNVGGDALVEKTGTDTFSFKHNFMDMQYASLADSLIKQDAGGQGTIDIEYNEFANIASHPLQFNLTANVTMKYNYLHGLTAGGAHGDYFILNSIGTPTQTINETFDTIYVDSTSCTTPSCAAVNTTFGANITASGSPQTALVSSPISTAVYDTLTCSAGTGNQEDVTVTGVPDSTHFTGIFTHNHTSGDTVHRQAGGGTAICYMAAFAGDTLSGSCSNNTYIALAGTTQSYAIRLEPNIITSPNGPFLLQNNYIDFTGGFGEVEANCSQGGGQQCSAVSVTCTGNKKLIGGATITTVNGAPFFACN